MWFLKFMKNVFNIVFYSFFILLMVIFYAIDLMLYTILLGLYLVLMIKNYFVMDDYHKRFLQLVFNEFSTKENKIHEDGGENIISENILKDNFFKLKITYSNKGFFEIIENTLKNQSNLKYQPNQQDFDFFVTLPFILFFAHLKYGKNRFLNQMKGLSSYGQYSCSVIVQDKTKTLKELLDHMDKTDYIMESL